MLDGRLCICLWDHLPQMSVFEEGSRTSGSKHRPGYGVVYYDKLSLKTFVA